jgi:hypothetical protein
MFDKYGKEVEFYVVYIREAHPTDGRQVGENTKAGILIKQPTTIEERLAAATQMCTKLEISLPTLIDKLDDKVGQAYNAWPDRLYLVGRDGKIAYQGGPGPRGFRPEELEAAIKKELGLSRPTR